MVLTPPMVFSETDGIESVLLNHTGMRGPSVSRMRDFFYIRIWGVKHYLPFKNGEDNGFGLSDFSGQVIFFVRINYILQDHLVGSNILHKPYCFKPKLLHRT